MSGAKSNEVTVIFHDRIEYLLDIYSDDLAAFGRIMWGLFDYSINGTIHDLSDKRENADLKQLRSMIDVGREGKREYKVKQTINSNLRSATSEADMRERLSKKGLTEEEIQQGVDRYIARNKEENNQAKSWKEVDAYLGTNYSKE